MKSPTLLYILLYFNLRSTTSKQHNYDVLIYDASSGGITAAVSSGLAGHKTALLCSSYPACFDIGGRRIGGLSTNGLGQTDIGITFPYIGGLALEFYQRNRAHYGNVTTNSGAVHSSCRLPNSHCNVTFNLEPHVARQIFHDLLTESNVDIYYNSNILSIQKSNKRILSITTFTNDTFSSKYFIDASYEGDLLAMSNSSYSVGREAQSKYQETLAGKRMTATSHQFRLNINPFDDNGDPLPFTTLPDPTIKVGDADSKVQSYNFRLCVTKNKSNMVPFPKPKQYNASKFLLLQRYLIACNNDVTSSCQLGFPSCNTALVPNDKYDLNNCGPFSTDFIGGSWNYPNANYQERKNIWHSHYEYQAGLLYYISHEPLVPLLYRQEMSLWGLCADEFQDNTISPHWPPSLYVRAARRLIGDHQLIFTQNTPQEQKKNGSIGNLSIGIGGYNFDSHNAERMACHNKSMCDNESPSNGTGSKLSYTWNEGDIENAPGLYQIPLWVMFPKEKEVLNLLVIAAPSASHIGMSTLRMEPQFMMIGHAAGTVASLAITSQLKQGIQHIDVNELNALLLEQGMILEY